jgi:hypothetical protein
MIILYLLFGNTSTRLFLPWIEVDMRFLQLNFNAKKNAKIYNIYAFYEGLLDKFDQTTEV